MPQMRLPSFKEFDKTKYEKYAQFDGRILILGYGSVGQAILPVVLRHIVVDPRKVTVLERDNHRQLFVRRHGGSGVHYVRQEINVGNYKKELKNAELAIPKTRLAWLYPVLATVYAVLDWLYAELAVVAAEFIAGKKGNFSMKEVLGF
mgnify:CR=1 FL=1